MTPPTRAIASAVTPGESQSAANADDDRGATHTGKVIPVGQEPPPLLELAADALAGPDEAQVADAGVGSAEPGKSVRKSGRAAIRNPDGLRRHQNALREIQVFRSETMRHLRRSEIAVWLGIHGCQGPDGARITYARLAELTGTSRRHVGGAIQSLNRRGLLEILAKGRFRPGSDGESGLASRYRVYPVPQTLLQKKDGAETHAAPNADNRCG